MKKTEWFEKWFSSKLYLELYKHRDERDARDIVNLIQRSVPLEQGSEILDVCCGAGRHSIELARRSYSVTGFDLSSYLISQAKNDLRKSPERNLKVKFLIKDMRDFDFRGKFDLAANLFTSFGYFDNDEENFKVFDNVKSSLRKGGIFVFDFLNTVYLEKNIVPRTVNKYSGYTMTQKRRIEDGFVIKDITITKGNKHENFMEKLRLYTPAELSKVVKGKGFEVLKSFGNYYGDKFSQNSSPRFILIMRKS